MEDNVYTVLCNHEFGRFVVAARDLDAGEEVLSEDAAVVGPKHHTPPVCLGCHAPTSAQVVCSKCGWPVCDAACESSPAHLPECRVFAAAKVTFGPAPKNLLAACPQLECITPLRLLLTTGSERWMKEVSLMETHESKRRNGVDWNTDQINIVNFLLQRCKLKDRYDDALVHQVCGILAVNAFEAHSANDQTALRAIFPQLALLAHSCVPNTTHSIDRNYRVRVRTTVPVAKDQPLYTTYTHSLHPTHSRREHLRLGKYFDCKCSRCSDPTELGSHLSTFKCSQCKQGWVIPCAPLSQDADWKCDNCEYVMPNKATLRVMEFLSCEVSSVEPDDVDAREALIQKYETSLHPRHAAMTALKHSLCQLYGRAEGYCLQAMSDALLRRKIDLCRHVLGTADILEPGKTRLRGWLLYELHAPLVLLARSQFKEGVISRKTLLSGMQEAADVLEESVEVLGLEDGTTIEGQLASQGRSSLQQLRASIQSLTREMDINDLP